MTIGIDARLYGTKHGGIGRYTEELIRNLLAIDPAARDYVFFVYNKEDEELIRADMPTEAKSCVRFVLAPHRWYTLAEQLFMPLALARAKVDIMHFTHFNVPLAYRAPFIVTIHDLIIHHFPDERATTLPKWLYRIKLWGYKKVMRHAVEKASAIIVPTEATKRDVLQFYKIDAGKVKVIYEGATDFRIMNHELRIKDENKFQNPNDKSMSKSKIKNFDKYILYVGSFYPHKNIERLIDACHILRAKYNLDIKLVLIGKKDYFQKQVQKHLTVYGLRFTAGCVFYGHATDAELAELYQNATLFVFPSLYEGFGLPPLEAMSFGTPVVASNASCIPEVLGDAALYFNPSNVEDMAETIHTLYTNASLQTQLRDKGFTKIKNYSWAKMAQETLQIYAPTPPYRSKRAPLSILPYAKSYGSL